MSRTVFLKQDIKKVIRSSLPLPLRKRLAVWINQQKWLACNRRSWWSLELIRDVAQNDINEYHKFLWSNHLSYAETYEVASRFGSENMKESRKMFFSELRESLSKIVADPGKDIRSVFEVGCSLGYQLRFLETDVFPFATQLEGIDIDKHAIEPGSGYLGSIGSKVVIKCADMEELDSLLEDKIYDVIMCTGVLMYLNEDSAARLVETILRHTGGMAAFTGLAHADFDNSKLQHSVTRDSDKSFVHNIDTMVKRAGGKILARRWEGPKLVDGQACSSA